MILTLAVVGIYEAFTLPIAVFPTTNFPRIIVGVDNGVMPINQMEVTITRPIEEAVNSVPGLQNVRSITSRGSAEIDLDFDLGRRHDRDAPASGFGDRTDSEHIAFDGSDRGASAGFRELSDPGLQHHVGQSSADPALGNGHLRSQAATKPAGRRGQRFGAGRPAAGISDHP